MSGPLTSASAAFVAKNSRIPPYAIEQSLRFDGGSFTRRDPSSAGNRRTWTFSFWLKKCQINGDQTILMTAKNSGYSRIDINSASHNSVNFLQWNGSSYDFKVALTSGRLRDPSAWCHIVVAVDTTQSTASNRVKFYVNGNLETDLDSNATSYPSQNFDIELNGTGRHYLGTSVNYGPAYLNGYLAEVNYIDGSQLAATDFGEYDSSGVWRPIEYSGSYTGNSYYLKFDASNVEGDSSGLNNDWTGGSFVTSGTGTDVMSDTPTTNWCTLNSVDNGGATLAEGNLSWDSGSNQGTRSTFFVDSGKWYWELTSNESNLIGEHGVADASQVITGTTAYPGYAASSWGFSNSTGRKVNNNSFTNIATTGSQNDVIMVALDMDDGKIWWGRNGTWFSSGDPAAGSNAAFTNLSGYNVSPMSGVGGAAAGAVIYNFGQRAFAYTPPTGFKALNTKNLPAPTIKDGSDYFNTVLYTGTQGTLSVTGVGFQPDWVWIKNRGSAQKHMLFDSVRNVLRSLSSNNTDQEAYESSAGYLSAFGTDGFTVVEGTSAGVNWNNDTFVSWNWLAGGSASSNTDGTITSTVNANTTAGFSIVSWSGTGNSETVGHGLGVAPSFYILKSRDNAEDWAAYFTVLDGSLDYIALNTTNAKSDSGLTAPTSTVIYRGTADANNESMIAYCFAEVEGYSKFTSYTGNNNNDGVFCYLGFKPSWLLIKGTNSAYWYIWDEQRSTYNAATKVLLPSDSAAEQDNTTRSIDFLSNGFKLRTNDININANGQQYIVAAFASNPFGGEGVNPATTR